MDRPLQGRRVLVTGIHDEGSLALAIARTLRAQGAELVCAGLGPTPHHGDLPERVARRLEQAWSSFQATVAAALGPATVTARLDATLDPSLDELAARLARDGLAVDGLVHSIALDRTIRDGKVKPILEVGREEFLSCMDASAYSLLALVRALVRHQALRRGGSLVALSYLGAERVPTHPYKNVAVAKAALERLCIELAVELGRSHAVRVNAVRFSPWTASRAGGAIEGLERAEADAETRSPLGNGRPEDLAAEVAHLLAPGLRVTGEVRHVDGGYHVLA